MSHLNSGRLNLSLLREISRTDLFSLLDSIDGTKAIVWDPKLIGPIGLISDYGSLKEHRVIQMLELRSGQLPVVNAQNLIYFIQPKLSFIDIIAENVKIETRKMKLPSFNFHLIFLPRKCILCERKLETLGVFGDFSTINEFSPDFYTLDYDIISLEWSESFKECNLEMDYSSLYHLARSLLNLQCVFGIIPYVCGIGRLSKILYDIMAKMKNELTGIETNVLPLIDQMILIDRSVDLLTPSIFQLSYEGLLDEIYGINQTVIRLPPEKFLQSDEQQQSSSNSDPIVPNPIEPSSTIIKKRFYLNSDDELFKKLRDLYYLSVGPILHISAKNLATQFDERHTAKTVREIKQFVEKIPYLKRLKNLQSNHTSMAELIREFTDREEFHDILNCENNMLNCYDIDQINPIIETMISCQADLIQILRLILIQSICSNGLKQKIWDFYRREIVQTYGYKHLLTLTTLEQCGLIRLSSDGYGVSYSSLRQRFQLIRNKEKESINNNNNNDPTTSSTATNPNVQLNQGYVHDTYIPLSLRMIQHIEQFGFRSFQDLIQRNLKSDTNHSTKSSSSSSTSTLMKLSPANTYILFDAYQSIGYNKRNNSNNHRPSDSDSNSIQSDNNNSSSINTNNNQSDKLTLIIFIGGCTYSEISSLRLLSQKENSNVDYLIGTTSIINGTNFIKSLTPTTTATMDPATTTRTTGPR